jgi:hypothetical protein
MLSNTAPTNIMPNDPTSATPALVNPILCNVAVNPIHTALASVIPVDLVPIDPDPVNLSLITVNDCNPTAYMPVNHTHITFAHPMPTVSVPTDPNNAITISVDPMIIDSIPINSAPIDHVHVNPVATTPADLSLIITAISHISFMFIVCFGHQLIH